MVKNASQKQLQQGATHAQTREEELSFFRSHPYFSQVPEELLGVHMLTQTLTNILVERIRRTLPSVRWLLEKQQEQVVAQLSSLGAQAPHDAAHRQHAIMQVRAATLCAYVNR
jgi:hypothetical protein